MLAGIIAIIITTTDCASVRTAHVGPNRILATEMVLVLLLESDKPYIPCTYLMVPLCSAVSFGHQGDRFKVLLKKNTAHPPHPQELLTSLADLTKLQ